MGTLQEQSSSVSGNPSFHPEYTVGQEESSPVPHWKKKQSQELISFLLLVFSQANSLVTPFLKTAWNLTGL